MSFLVRFLRNLLMGEHNELRNRDLLIDPPAGWGSALDLRDNERKG